MNTLKFFNVKIICVFLLLQRIFNMMTPIKILEEKPPWVSGKKDIFLLNEIDLKHTYVKTSFELRTILN